MAGLIRSGLYEKHGEIIHPLSIDCFIPAAGQGILAVQALRENKEVLQLTEPINHPQSVQALREERQILRRLQADCHSCIAVHIYPKSKGWSGCGMAGRPDGTDFVRLEVSGSTAKDAGEKLLEIFFASGVQKLL